MSQIVVRYRVKPDRAEENASLVRAVYEELAEVKPDGFRSRTASASSTSPSTRQRRSRFSRSRRLGAFRPISGIASTRAGGKQGGGGRLVRTRAVRRQPYHRLYYRGAVPYRAVCERQQARAAAACAGPRASAATEVVLGHVRGARAYAGTLLLSEGKHRV
jgi:hypothetical protein